MKKLYFAKYLFEEEEIEMHLLKDGELITDINEPSNGIWKYANDPISNMYTYQISSNSLRKVKLFICSRDIQIGDKLDCTYDIDGIQFNKKGEVIATPTNLEKYIYSIKVPDTSFKSGYAIEYIPIDKAYKIIGVIDSLSYSVKEGEEFDINQLEFVIGYDAYDFYDPFYEELVTEKEFLSIEVGDIHFEYNHIPVCRKYIDIKNDKTLLKRFFSKLGNIFYNKNHE